MSAKEPLQGSRLQLCVFDSARDYPEGEEAKRILAYYPTGCTVDEQTAVVGLAEALSIFSGNFDDEETCSDMLADHSQWTFHTPEQHISMILDANHAATKSMLQTLLAETAARLLCSKSSDLAALQSPLSLVYGVSWMPLAGPLFAATHSFASQLALASLGSGQSVQEVVLLHDQYCMWSSLPQQETEALYQLASSALLPASKRPSIAKRIAKATSSQKSRNAEVQQHPIQNHKAWIRQHSGFLSLAPEGIETQTQPELAIIPTVHIQNGNEEVGLLGYCQGSMLLLMLLSQPDPVSMTTQQTLLHTVHAPLRRLDSDLKQHLSVTANFHIPGFRYLFVDHMLAAVQASPSSKVSTLSSHSVALMSTAQRELQSMDPQQADREVIARGSHDCWVVAKHRNGRELYVVLEGRGEIGLSGASKLAAQFSSEHLASLGF